MERVALLVNTASDSSNQTVQTWAEHSLNPAIADVQLLGMLESDHFLQLGTIANALIQLNFSWTCFTARFEFHSANDFLEPTL
jgi:hypothetical protein